MGAKRSAEVPDDLKGAIEAELLKTRGGQWKSDDLYFSCLDHDDEHPSARWDREKGVYFCDPCGKGAGAFELAKRLGLKLRDERRTIVARYDYKDADGRLLYQAVRYLPKGFKQRQPDGRGGYIWNLKGVRAVLYRLPELLASAPSTTAYIVEGEADVERLRGLGCVATCNSGGAGKWRPEYGEPLQGRHVVILPDNDHAGREHAETVARSLDGKASSIKIVELPNLPERGDVSDWLGAGGTLETLGEMVAAAPEWMPDDSKSRSLPVIQVNARPLRDITRDALDAIVTANDPTELYVRFGTLARVRADELGRPIIEAASPAIIRHRLARVAECVRVVKAIEQPTAPPRELIEDVLALGRWPGLPPLEAVTEVPVLRPDGSVLDAPGYDPATRLVYVPPPALVLPKVPIIPADGEIEAARALLLDLVADFPFVNAAARANTLALLMTPVLRPAIRGQVPLALIDKPKRGTGASLVAFIVQIIAVGKATDLMVAAHDDEEWRKKITAALINGTTVMFFDNVEHVLSSPSLAAALTAPEWSDRILGKSEMAKALPQRATWMATGNNLRVGGDLARRCYWIRLDAGVARPWQREGFRYPDILDHVLKNRGRVLAAILTLARAWFAAGCPRAKVPKLGGFDGWAATVGGVLAHVGIEHFLANLDDLYAEVDEDEVAWEGFIAAWRAHYDDKAVTVAELAEGLKPENSPVRRELPEDLADALRLDGKERVSFKKRLGRALGQRADAVFGDLKLVKMRSREHNTNRWQVIAAGGSGEVGEVVPAPRSVEVDLLSSTALTSPGDPAATTPPTPPLPPDDHNGRMREPGEDDDNHPPACSCWTCAQGAA